MPRISLQIMLGISIALATFYFWQPADLRTPDAETAERRNDLPKTYLHNIRRWHYDEKGQLADIMEAVQAQDFASTRETLFSQPRIYSHDGNDRTWSASAEEGRMRHGPQTLYLRRKVQLLNDQTGARLDTRAMTLNLRNKTAVSRVPVTITQGENQTRADGMVADLNLEQIRLQPNVESIYVPPPR